MSGTELKELSTFAQKPAPYNPLYSALIVTFSSVSSSLPKINLTPQGTLIAAASPYFVPPRVKSDPAVPL